MKVGRKLQPADGAAQRDVVPALETGVDKLWQLPMQWYLDILRRCSESEGGRALGALR